MLCTFIEVTAKHVNRGAGYGLVEIRGHIYLSSAACGCYGEAGLGNWDAVYQSLLLLRGGHYWEVVIS